MDRKGLRKRGREREKMKKGGEERGGGEEERRRRVREDG